MANGPSSSSAGWKREPPQTAHSSGSSPSSSNSCAAASGLAPIVRHSPSRVSIFIISAGPLHSGGVGARRGLRAGRSRGEGTEIGSVGGISVACGSCISSGGFSIARAPACGSVKGITCGSCGSCWLRAFLVLAHGHVFNGVCVAGSSSSIISGQTHAPAAAIIASVCKKDAKELDAMRC